VLWWFHVLLRGLLKKCRVHLALFFVALLQAVSDWQSLIVLKRFAWFARFQWTFLLSSWSHFSLKTFEVVASDFGGSYRVLFSVISFDVSFGGGVATGLNGHSSSAFLVALVNEKIVVGNFLGRLEIDLFDGFFGGNSGGFDLLGLLVLVVKVLPLLNYRIELILFGKEVILGWVGISNKRLGKTLTNQLTFDAFAIKWILKFLKIIIKEGVLFFVSRVDYNISFSLGLLLLMWLCWLLFIWMLGVE
jgi:hypothetical protein